MRAGLRSLRAFKRRGVVTELKGTTAMFGPYGVLAAVSPYRDNGPDPATQNAIGNHYNSNAGNAGFLSNLGETNYDIPYMQSASGARGLDRLPANARGCRAYRFRLEFNDGPAAGSTLPRRKQMTRFGDTGANLATGLGVLSFRGVPHLRAFSFRLSAASRAKLQNSDAMLIWQIKNSVNSPGCSININAHNYSDSGALGTTGSTPRLVFQAVDSAGAKVQSVIKNDIPHDVACHLIVRVTSVFGTGVGVGASNEVWFATQDDAAFAKPVDNTGCNLNSDSDLINEQWGCYHFADNTTAQSIANGTGGWPNSAPFWAAGDFYDIDFGEYTRATPEVAARAPTAAQLAQWLATMKVRAGI